MAGWGTLCWWRASHERPMPVTAIVGERAPDATLMTLDGQSVQLAQAWQASQPALLIFLRHLG